MAIAANILRCHACEHRRLVGTSLLCGAPGGGDCVGHARASSCPLGLHDAAPDPPRPTPVSGEHWGPPLWTKMHLRPLSYIGDAAAELAFLRDDVPAAFGCGGCLPEWAAMLGESPPDLSSAENYARWLHAAHDRVSVRLGKPAFPWPDAVARYGYPASWL